MEDVEVTVREAHARRDGDGRRGTVLMLPGRAYPCEMSLLAWTTRALQSAGWVVLQAGWQLVDLPEDPRSFVEGAAQRLDATERRPGPVLVVAKSLGTLAAHWSADRGYPAVWLTPVLRTAGLNPMPDHSGALAHRIRTYPTDNLVIGGTSDPLWENGFTGTGKVIEIDGADHGLEVDDWRASIRHHADVAASVVDFADSIRWESRSRTRGS
jgi:hypothetical protein